MLKTEANAWRAIEHRKLEVNSDGSQGSAVTVGILVNRYLEMELPELRHSTANAYRSYLNHQITPRSGEYPISKVKPFAVEQWLKDLDLASRTKGHLHNLMRVLWNRAMRWELTEIGENPMKLVRVRGTSKRRCEPIVLDIAQFRLLLKELDGPFPQARFQNPEDWMFASPFRAGRTPWDPWSVERRHIIPAAIRCGIGRIGWHSFRHTFRTLLDETGAPMKVQQELMRHADIRTTMNVYGKAMDASKREAHGNVVRMLLAPKVA